MRRHLTLEEISAWLDGEVELGEAEHRHLRECTECGAVLDGHQRLRRLARKAMPRVPTDDIWRGIVARLTPAPAPVVDRAIPASRALVLRGGRDRGPGPRRAFRLHVPIVPARAAAFLAAVLGVIAVLLVLPRTPPTLVPAGPLPHPMIPKPARAEAARGDPARAATELRGVQARRGRITFELGKAALAAGSEAALGEAASILARYPHVDVTVEGHTDNTGGTAWNLDMSRARAEAVVRWLVDRGGVAAGRLTARGLGSARPVADNSTEAGQDANRRVEFIVAGAPASAPERAPVRAPAALRAPSSPAPVRAAPPPPPPAVPRPTYAGIRFRLTADRFTTASPELISAAGHVLIEPVDPGEPWAAVVDGFSRTLTGTAKGVVAEVINPGEHLILHTGAPGVPVHPVP